MKKFRKEKNSEFLAVNNVSFKVYQNEIFAILGHNGAGKTTLINVMVGLLKANEGDVYFDGKSIAKDTNSIRENFGVCAQSNIIYDNLTVEQHIIFYGKLKGIVVDVDSILKDLDLLSQKKTKASKLSGGQKRKLCIGMAIIGNPKYIFLDEPTTGLDPLSRRRIWELLSKHKKGKVIFLTTHYMDEADILADRKLILNKGKVRCLGTSLYLKNHFNMNYNLDVETENYSAVNDLIQSYFPNAIYVKEQKRGTKYNNDRRSGNDTVKVHTWRLPLNSTNKFSELLNEIERQVDQGSIKKFGLSMPTLEELFIRLEDNTIKSGDKDLDNQQYSIKIEENNLSRLKPVQKLSRFSLLKNLIKYRLKIFLKDKGFAFSNILLPVIISCVTFVLMKKFFNTEKKSNDISVISMSDTYSNSFINLDPQSSLGITPENIISVIGNAQNVKTTPLSNIPHPKNNDKYYVSSINGEEINNHYNLKIYYNDTMTHAIPATLNTISNTILASKNVNDKIVVKSSPYDNKNDLMAVVSLTIAGLIVSMFIINNINKFGPLIVRERLNQLLQQLQLNGVSRVNYWISCFVSDNIIFISICILIFISGIIVGYQPLLDVKIIVIILIVLVIWSIPTMLYQYILSFIFNSEETAYSVMSVLNVYPAVIGYIIFALVFMNNNSNVVDKIAQGKGIYNIEANIFSCALTAVFPIYGLVSIVNTLFTLKMYEKLINYNLSISNIIKLGNGITPIIIVLAVLIVVLFFVLIYLDTRINQTTTSDINELPESTCSKYEEYLSNGDEDIKEEFEYVKNHQQELPISVYHLSKEYKIRFGIDRKKKQAIMSKEPDEFKFGEIHKSIIDNNKLVKTAVIDVNFGVRNHECFGLLGPNGAGKSTTLNTITSTIPQTTGKICFNGVETYISRLNEISMGYCPQNDILWKELTLREHLELFLSIRGYSGEEVKEYATQYIDCVGLGEHQNKRVENLSGGTKRKLSLLIAIVGYPHQILLDEPTAGMDPSTRRLIWNTIEKTKSNNNSSLILTTHSMEEAEYLCDRLAILVNGRLNCIGSSEHLKMKFGEGYILEVQSNEIERFHSSVIEEGKLFGNNEYVMENCSSNRNKYNVKMTHHLGYVFDVMEQCKNRGLVTDYTFSQTTLEHVFIDFAKKQIIDNDNN